jgi:nucleoid-associated protein YgaU
LWTAIGLLAALGVELPGLAGRSCRHVARIMLPRVAYRVLAGAAGVGVLLTPALANAAPSTPPPVAAAASTPTPTWPTGSDLPSPGWPVGAAAVAPPTDPARPVPPAGPAHRSGPSSVLVRPGQSLWRIAAEHLPPHASDAQIAAAWPHWYAANRTTVGPDPGRLAPGQVLHAPVSPQEDST